MGTESVINILRGHAVTFTLELAEKIRTAKSFGDLLTFTTARVGLICHLIDAMKRLAEIN